MNRCALVLMVALLLARQGRAAAEATAPADFPIRQELGVLFMNGWPVSGKAATLFVTTRDDGFSGYGSAGCNSWSAEIKLGAEGSMHVGAIRTTRMACAPEIMQTERTFLEALARPLRWRREHGMLVLENEGNKLMLAPVFQQR
jgi:heat shock protein HslJ